MASEIPRSGSAVRSMELQSQVECYTSHCYALELTNEFERVTTPFFHLPGVIVLRRFSACTV